MLKKNIQTYIYYIKYNISHLLYKKFGMYRSHENYSTYKIQVQPYRNGLKADSNLIWEEKSRRMECLKHYSDCITCNINTF